MKFIIRFPWHGFCTSVIGETLMHKILNRKKKTSDFTGKPEEENMSFKISKPQKEIQKAARDFAKGEFDKDLAFDMERAQKFPEDVRNKAAGLGFIGIHYPEEYYGAGLGILENVLLAEEFCKKDSSMGIGLMLSGFAAECILRFGTDSLKDRFLSGIASGEMLSGEAFTESVSGYDTGDIKTWAQKKEDAWIINGQKTLVTNGGKAGVYCVLCRTDPGSIGADGISMILAEGNSEGLLSVNPRDKLGMRMVSTSDLVFNNVKVPCSNLVGKQGKGVLQALAFYDEARILLSAMALGTARGAFLRALDYVRQRELFGKKLAGFQVTRHKLADMAMGINIAEHLVYEVAADFDSGRSDSGRIAMAGLSACQAAIDVSSEAIQLLGGYGYMAEYELERFYRDAKSMGIFLGNTGMMKDIIAKNIIEKIK